MGKARSGWERQIFYDSPGGATATTHIDEHVVDIGLDKTNDYTETVDRGDGLTLPKNTEQAVARTRAPSFSMRYYSDDAIMADLLAAVDTATPLAFLVKRHDGGATEWDGDAYIEYTSPGNLKDGQLVEFTLKPTEDLGRKWSDS